jgi:deazaflavin-dependent oxidoreductase (nitroreductase family)
VTGSRSSLRSWPQQIERLIFRPVVMPLQIALYRWTGGRIGGTAGEVRFLLLTTVGRKSGKVSTTPLAYIDHEDGYLVTATNAGMPRHPGWYHNLKARTADDDPGGQSGDDGRRRGGGGRAASAALAPPARPDPRLRRLPGADDPCVPDGRPAPGRSA